MKIANRSPVSGFWCDVICGSGCVAGCGVFCVGTEYAGTEIAADGFMEISLNADASA